MNNYRFGLLKNAYKFAIIDWVYNLDSWKSSFLFFGMSKRSFKLLRKTEWSLLMVKQAVASQPRSLSLSFDNFLILLLRYASPAAWQLQAWQ